ncbi:MAG: DUF4942 domain-containing protein [Moraxellaceae bacterium]
MNAVTEIMGEIADLEFFAPASTDLVDGLVGQYRQARARIESLANVMAGELSGALHYFIQGNLKDERHGIPTRIDRLMQAPGAIAALNADYWQRALGLTDVLDCMPQKRRDEWFEQIREQTTPDFEEETVRDTIGALLAARSRFFAERVDGIFRALSGAHVTNRPEGFGKRMIMGRVLCEYGTVNHSQAGTINDLRCVVAKFMGRDEPRWDATAALIKAAKRNPGEWMEVDGGSIRLRVYAGVGTAHLEVHPDMAWRLNAVLASIYPLAIPPKFRQRPARKAKEHALMQRPLPFEVVEILAGLAEARELVDSLRNRWNSLPRTRALGYGYRDNKVAVAEAARVLEAIGGVRVAAGHFQFDYEPQAVLDLIVCSGCIPDDKTHQFYPTPESLAARAVELAGIEDGHRCLEPSAGTGSLADLMPKDTHCVEVSAMRAGVLEAKGYAVTRADFLELVPMLKPRFDRVVMNPPFSGGRWRAHLEAAAALLAPGGRLVAILPASARGADLLHGLALHWHGPYENEFAGTSVSVVILVAERGAA